MTLKSRRSNYLDVCFVNALPVPWEAQASRLLQERAGSLRFQAPYTGAGLVQWTSRGFLGMQRRRVDVLLVARGEVTRRGADKRTDDLWAPAPRERVPWCSSAAPASAHGSSRAPRTGQPPCWNALGHGVEQHHAVWTHAVGRGRGGLSVFFFKHFSHLFGGEASFLPSSGAGPLQHCNKLRVSA